MSIDDIVPGRIDSHLHVWAAPEEVGGKKSKSKSKSKSDTSKSNPIHEALNAWVLSDTFGK